MANNPLREAAAVWTGMQCRRDREERSYIQRSRVHFQGLCYQKVIAVDYGV